MVVFRLVKHFVHTQFLGFVNSFPVADSGQNHNRQLFHRVCCFQDTECVKSVQPGQLDIEQDKIKIS